VYVCVHPRIHGHTDLNTRTPSGGGAMSDTEKAERRTVVANNEAWRSAENVRRAWLTDFLTRRTPPKGSARFVATALAHGNHALSRAFTNGHQRARDLFRLDHLTGEADDTADRRPGKTLAALLDGTTDNRALVVALGIALAAYEDAWNTDTWRRPSPADARYLMFLTANGYQPSDVEQLILGAPIPSASAPEDDEVEVSDRDE
jgi:ParB family chromosome partitioning protein